MPIVFTDAVRADCPLNIGLVGPSGSGKTLSALLLAQGIQKIRGGEIIGIDTEARRMLQYADRIKFKHGVLSTFSSKAYTEAILTAAKLSNRGVVIVDSMSHEHEGIEGYLAFHDKEAARLGGGEGKSKEAVSWRAWAAPAAARRQLINTILQQDIALICCFRAKEKSVMSKDTNGKSNVVSIGWQAIAGDEFVYEQTVRMLLLPGAQGLPDWSKDSFAYGVAKASAELLPLVNDGKQISIEMGERLALWAKGSVAASNVQADTKERNRIAARTKDPTSPKEINAKPETSEPTDKPQTQQQTNDDLAQAKITFGHWVQLSNENRTGAKLAAIIKSVCKKSVSQLETLEDFKNANRACAEMEQQLHSK